jgi:nifR3 family TIM-barrel protein
VHDDAGFNQVNTRPERRLLLRKDALAEKDRHQAKDVTPRRRRLGQEANYTRDVSLFSGNAPLLTLAPMQDVTNGAFWTLIHRYGGADVYWTEYFRVHETSTLEPWIRKDITTNSTGRPIVAQMIGNDIPSLIRTAKQLAQMPVAAIDLNLGCPAPIVYRKCAGGGLLRDPQRIDRIVGALRDAIAIPFTVKTRLGFESPQEFDGLLSIFAKHSLDALTVHGRTVNQQYRLPVYYERIRQAVEVMPCPVIANGHVYSAAQAEEVLRHTGARGLMIGRGAIRSPWLFTQIRQHLRGEAVTAPTGREVLAYIRALWDSQANFDKVEQMRCDRMKKFLYYFGEGVTAAFWNEMRRTKTEADFHRICEEYFDHDRPMDLEPAELAAV